jgi:molybdate transport repressor ModE-like protein
MQEETGKLNFRLRIDIENEPAIGAGKIRLLDSLLRTKNITISARQIGMSPNRAWLHIHQLNVLLKEPVLLVNKNIINGVQLSSSGIKLLNLYHELESQIQLISHSYENDFLNLIKK